MALEASFRAKRSFNLVDSRFPSDAFVSSFLASSALLVDQVLTGWPFSPWIKTILGSFSSILQNVVFFVGVVCLTREWAQSLMACI